MRLGLVLALAHRPELVVLDDPALGLDPIMRKQFNRDLITHLQGEGRTVFYSSHLLYEVEPVADEVAILDHGRDRPAGGDRRTPGRREADYSQSRSGSAAGPVRRRILDQRPDGPDVALVVEEAESIITALEQEGVEHRVVDLNLDEIFEAYVAGRREREQPTAELVPQT